MYSGDLFVRNPMECKGVLIGLAVTGQCRRLSKSTYTGHKKELLLWSNLNYFVAHLPQ